MRCVGMHTAISMENIVEAWDGFRRGKRKRADVQRFELNLEDNLFQLHDDCISKTYRHQPYEMFHVWDPKHRVIHKASVRDRIVHHLLFRYLEPIYQPRFIRQSYACQTGKGIHRAIEDLDSAFLKTTQNNTRTIWGLKLDVEKFFDSIDHQTLFGLLKPHISDQFILWLLNEVVESYHSWRGLGMGVPIGNLTSQIFANIYLSELDYFAKHRLREQWYFRYADDVLILHEEQRHLEAVKDIIGNFLQERLHLTLHPNKVSLRKFSHGIDFVGYIFRPHYRTLRTSTKRRMLRRVGDNNLSSYLGLLSHCSGYRLGQRVMNDVYLNSN